MSKPQPTYQQAIRFARKARESGDSGSARRWAAVAARLAPDEETPWLLLGALAKPRASIEYYKQALKVNPQSRIARIGLRRAENKLAQDGTITPTTKSVSTQFVQAVPTSSTVRRKTPILAWLLLPSFLAGLVIFLWGNFSSLQSIVASAELLPSATPPLRLAVRGNQLTATPTFTPTPTPTFTPSPTPTFTPTPTATYTLTPTATAKPTDSPMSGNLTSRPSQVGKNEFWIEVNLTTQQLYAHRGDKLLKTFTVSTGTWATPTVVGQYQIYVKLFSTNMAGPGYYLPDVPYTMYFYKGYGVHGTYWHNNFGTPMSHGCVNMRTSEASWVFDQSVVGTWVIIHY
ncbi:MAG: L,D-transpeptidase family protein [Aliifodinibius sp.]|nr:L,D-transpeptidase [Phycisphaerae bacterium]NIV10385.1 L,D-transpeptidase family protein [Fodinibius sp.]